MAKSKSTRNVGTNGRPVSWLHERAVALLYDELLSGMESGGEHPDGIRVRLNPGDSELSHDLTESVVKVKVPGEWDSVGGVIPDLILLGHDDSPVRIIEVVVNSPPSKAKRQKLDTLVRRGVDVVEVKVQHEKDLRHLCWSPATPVFNHNMRKRSVNLANNQYIRQRIGEADGVVNQLATALRNCSPRTRRSFLDTLQHVSSLDSLFPVRPDNPLKDKLMAGDDA